MGAPNGPAPELLALLDALAEAPYRYDFFAAVRAIEAANPASSPLGAAARPADEPVRLGQRASMRFAPAALCAVERAAGRTWVMGEFFGLFGPNGPLPIHLTEHALSRRINADDPTFQRFADLFHHRLLALLYRAWASARPAVGFHRGEGAAFRRQLGALTGTGERDDGGGNGAAFDADARRYFAASFAPGPRSAEGLARMVAACFRVSAEVVEFVGQWLDLPAESRCRLGRGQAAVVGGSAVVGARVWTGQTRFRLVVGPVGLYRFLAFLPGQPALARLASMIEQYVGPGMTWELVLKLTREEAPAMALGEQGRLGWTSWLGRVPERRSTCDVVLSGERSGAGAGARLAPQQI